MIPQWVLRQALDDAGVRQVLQWAAAYVENETAIPECPAERLTQDERAGLQLLQRAGVLTTAG